MQANTQASEQSNKQASEQASKQAGRQAGKQARKQASKDVCQYGPLVGHKCQYFIRPVAKRESRGVKHVDISFVRLRLGFRFLGF